MTVTSDTYFFGTHDITNENLVAGPPDAENQIYDLADAPYALGAEVWDAGHAYRSLIGDNNDLLSDPVAWKDLGEVDLGAFAHDLGTTYALGDYAILNGRRIRSAIDGNTTDPEGDTNPEHWADAGPTNRFRAFDLKSNTFSLGVGVLSWEFQNPLSMNTMLLLLPLGGQAVITIRDSFDEIIEQRTYSLTRDSGGGPYNHDFSPTEQVGRVIVHGLPPGLGYTTKLEITGGDDQEVGIAQVGMGFAHDVGATVIGTRVTIAGFKDVTEDEFGNLTFPNRPIRRILRMSLATDLSQTERVLTRVGPYINKPAGLYLVDGVELGLCAIGVVRELDLPIDNPLITTGTIELKGLAE